MATVSSESACQNKECLTVEEGQVVNKDSKAQAIDEECKSTASHNHVTGCTSKAGNLEEELDKSHNGIEVGEPLLTSAADNQVKKKGKKREDRGIGKYSTDPVYLYSFNAGLLLFYEDL